jgi:hypothetical protein
VTPEQVHNLLADLVKSKMGEGTDRYLAPMPNANVPKLTAEQALGQILNGILPQGMPAEGAQAHLQALTQFTQADPRFAVIAQTDPHFQTILQAWMQQVQMLVMQEQQQAMAAQQFADAMGGGGGTGGPQGQVDPQADQMQPQGPNQPMDESMPGAKGQV